MKNGPSHGSHLGIIHYILRYIYIYTVYTYYSCQYYIYVPGTQMGPLVLIGVWALFWQVDL